MIGRSERLPEVRRAVPADRQKTIGEAETLLTTDAIEPLTNGNCDGGRHAFPGQFCQFLCQSVCFLVLYVQAHVIYLSTISMPPFYRNASNEFKSNGEYLNGDNLPLLALSRSIGVDPTHARALHRRSLSFGPEAGLKSTASFAPWAGSSIRRVRFQNLRAALTGSIPASFHHAASFPTR